MHRIYKVEVTHDYVLQTTFFNGEVRELNIETDLRNNESYSHLLVYGSLLNELIIDKSRTKVSIEDGPSFSYDELYYDAKLKEIVYIDDVNVQIASKAQTMRENRGMTQKDLEQATGIHQSEISKIERAVGNPSVLTLQRIADASDYRINVSFDDRKIKRDVLGAVNIAPYIRTGKFQGEYVISDLFDIPDDLLYELIDGCLYDMATPSIIHQAISMKLSILIGNYIEKNKGDCKVFAAPTGMVFEDDERNYLIPDLMVICDKNKIKDNYIIGAADWIIEIASPGDPGRDYNKKHNIYMDRGVKEYWIIDPSKRRLVCFYRENNEIKLYNLNEIVGVNIYNNKLKIDLNEINAIIDEYS